MTDEDKELLDRVISNIRRYSIVVDNDAVWVQDNYKKPDDENYWTGFSEYGYEFIASLFNYLGIKAELV